MKRITIIAALLIICNVACKKSILNQANPNQPGKVALTTESGITSFALGLFEKWIYNVPNEGLTNTMVISWAQNSILGDETFGLYGNYSFRWTNQVYSVTLPGDSVVVNPTGKEQKTTLQGYNTRQAGENNAFQYEWATNYFVIGQANLIQASLKNKDLHFSGDEATKRAVLQAWAYWWKGYSYSRIGSIYLAAVINNAPADGTTTSTYLDRSAIITEANNNFDSCITVLSSISENDDYDAMMQAIIPSIFYTGTPVLDLKNGIVTPDMWIRQAYTYEARNLLVNKKVKDMTTGDWTQILTLTGKGIQSTDNVFVYALDPNLVNDLNGQYAGQGSLYVMVGDASTFLFPSERLIQDFKPGDQRFALGFELLDVSDWTVNRSNRGIQFGTRYAAIPIEDGGLYGTNNNLGIQNVAGTWDENTLMQAEALIRSGSDIEGGLQLIDAVRQAQNAGLPAVAGTGLNQAQAIEELRRERRIGLFLRGLAFYDARRWGVIDPVSQGGGRAGAIVLVPGNYINSAVPQALPCLMDYRYLNYFDVPQNELDFNTPASGSAPVTN